MATAPITDIIELTPSQIASLRTRLGIPATQQSGILSDSDASIAWQSIPNGVQYTVTALHSWKAKTTAAVDPDEIRAQIRKMILGE